MGISILFPRIFLRREGEGVHGKHHQRLEQHGQGGPATRETAIQETDTRDDEPDQEGHDGQVHVVELECIVLEVHVVVGGVAAVGFRGIERGLDENMSVRLFDLLTAT